MLTNIEHPVIDMHCHLRTEITKHTEIARKNGIDMVVYMANSNPPLDNLEIIKSSLLEKRKCCALPVSAITKRLKGQELIKIDEINPYVIGFSDDGKCLKDLDLFEKILRKNVLLLTHCEPETEYIKLYLEILLKVGFGKLHIQHVSLKSSVEVLRDFKKTYKKELCEKKFQVTAETCPHYFTYSSEQLETKVNPPLACAKDIHAIKIGLIDGTIDVIASDYAPLPRLTGIAGFSSLIPLSYGLVLTDVLTRHQLKEKLFLNPLNLIKNSEIGEIMLRQISLIPIGWTPCPEFFKGKKIEDFVK